jgi:hypothetical protein
MLASESMRFEMTSGDDGFLAWALFSVPGRGDFLDLDGTDRRRRPVELCGTTGECLGGIAGGAPGKLGTGGIAAEESRAVRPPSSSVASSRTLEGIAIGEGLRRREGSHSEVPRIDLR